MGGERKDVNCIFLCPRDNSEGDAFEISTNHSYFCLQCLSGNQLLLNLLTGWANLDIALVQSIAPHASHVCVHTDAPLCPVSACYAPMRQAVCLKRLDYPNIDCFPE